MPFYAGLDCSTQGMTATVIEVEGDNRRVVFEHGIEFDSALPQYGTVHGLLRSGEDPREVLAPPVMWAEALDRVMSAVAEGLGNERRRLAAISGSAQQHGSVYLTGTARSTLERLTPGQPLAAQVSGTFSRPRSPVWLDSSTTDQCRAITAAVGGEAALIALTGSRAFERFTGPQIRKLYETDPAAYAATRRIHLVSSFMASLLAGRDAPIDPGDGAGMNLMNIRTKRWAPEALAATAPDLAVRLPELEASWALVGALGPYWQARHKLPAARVVAWSGDNPCSLIGTGIVCEGRLGISLGTSDTVFGYMREPRVDSSGAGSVFGAPTGDYMGLTCFSNGSLARERVRDRFGLTWDGFSEALRLTPPGNDGAMMLPWFDAEITPPVTRPGVRERGLVPTNGPSHVRAVVEAQALAMKRHSAWMGVNVTTIHATGGAARNREILRVLADVFDAAVYQFEVRNSAALGAALRAYHADALARGDAPPWSEVVAGFAEPVIASRISPIPAHVRAYRTLEPLHAAFEDACRV